MRGIICCVDRGQTYFPHVDRTFRANFPFMICVACCNLFSTASKLRGSQAFGIILSGLHELLDLAIVGDGASKDRGLLGRDSATRGADFPPGASSAWAPRLPDATSRC